MILVLTHTVDRWGGRPQPCHADSWHRRCGSSPADKAARTVHDTTGTPKGDSWHRLDRTGSPRDRRFHQTSGNTVRQSNKEFTIKNEMHETGKKNRKLIKKIPVKVEPEYLSIDYQVSIILFLCEEESAHKTGLHALFSLSCHTKLNSQREYNNLGSAKSKRDIMWIMNNVDIFTSALYCCHCMPESPTSWLSHKDAALAPMSKPARS